MTGENANEKNFITVTRYLNMEGMLPFENTVADYVKETDNQVLYQVTPVYDGNNLVAKGVLMEGLSVEDEGENISFCVFCYNVQPNIVIDYATGERSAEGASEEPKEETPSNIDKPLYTAPTPRPDPDSTTYDPFCCDYEETRSAPNTPTQSVDCILNTNTHKFHYPDF